jgi:hypothetical protein
MASLIADRFLVRSGSPAAGTAAAALDLATGARVRLRIDIAGTRVERRTWEAACARAHADGVLLDFGFLGGAHRFEARVRRREQPRAVVQAPDVLSEWLEHPRPSSPRVLCVEELPDVRMARQRGFVPCDLALVGVDSPEPGIAAALAGRSVVLLDAQCIVQGMDLQLAAVAGAGIDFANRERATKTPERGAIDPGG